MGEPFLSTAPGNYCVNITKCYISRGDAISNSRMIVLIIDISI